jgi:aspartyl protease family protein
MAAWLALLVLVVSGFVLVGRHDAVFIAGMDAADLAMTASGLLLTVWLGGALLPQLRDTHPRSYRFILRSGGAALVLGLTVWLHGPLLQGAGAAWTAWGRDVPLPQVVGDAISQWTKSSLPAASNVPGERAVRIRSRSSGQFYANATLNGTPATLLVDSGAATVVLKAADAKNAGIDMAQLSFSVPVETARGTTYAARVRLRQVQVGIIALDDVEALVAQPGGLDTSLLGSSFLSRLRSYEFSGAFLTFRG